MPSPSSDCSAVTRSVTRLKKFVLPNVLPQQPFVVERMEYPIMAVTQVTQVTRSPRQCVFMRVRAYGWSATTPSLNSSLHTH